MPRLFQPSVSCPACSKPNDFDFRYCQRCGYQRQTRSYKALKSLKAPVDLCSIRERKKVLVAKQQATPYQKQRSALEMEFLQFLETTSKRDICAAIPDDVVDFLIWKDNFGKTVVHMVACPFFGENRVSSCVCPKRLAYGSVDSIIGKLRAMFNKYGRSATDSLFRGLPTLQLHHWLSPIYQPSGRNSSVQESCRNRLNLFFCRIWCFYRQK